MSNNNLKIKLQNYILQIKNLFSEDQDGGSNIIFSMENIENYVNFYSTETKKIFNKICIEAKLHCIDTVSALQNYNDKNYFPTHFPSNVHLTKIGHDVISSEIRNYVCKNLKNLSKDLQLKCKIN